MLTAKARDIVLGRWSQFDFNHLALAFVDLNNFESEVLEIHDGVELETESFYFDLASLTKALTMGVLAIKSPEFFSEDNLKLLEHRAGFPRWAILGKNSWRETVNSFCVKEEQTQYSDLSMLNLMLRYEEHFGVTIEEACCEYLDAEVCPWTAVPEEAQFPETGFRNGSVICGEVNDDNCYKIGRLCSHAGLFGTINGLVNSLYNIEKEYKITRFMSKAFDDRKFERFLYGWDTVSNPKETLAGTNAPKKTFGHLGFTGTSMWFDADSKKGWILLTNTTRKYWFNRRELTSLRKELGKLCWDEL